MKRISMILLSLLCVISFATSVFAASYAANGITIYNNGEKYEYINGLPINYITSSGYNVYILNTGTTHTNGVTLTNPVQANNGFAYIINNSNVTNSSYKNYYIASIAILWYQDYLNSNDANISSTLKKQIESTTNDTVCYYIAKLVNNAKNYSSNGNSIKFLDKEVTFNKNGNYYYSNVIDVETYNLNTNPTVRLYNAPTSAEIINNTVTANGTGSFQIRIPTSSLANFRERDFELYITAGSYNNTVYKYSNNGAGEVVYARTYATNGNQIEASMPINIKGITTTNVRINILDKSGNYIRGLSYSIYSGDCTNSTCYSDDLVQNFTTQNTYVTLNNVLTNGTYTLVNRSTNSTYNLPSRVAFVINNSSSIQDVTIEEDNYYNGYNYNNNYNNNNNYNYNNNNYNNYDNNAYYDNKDYRDDSDDTGYYAFKRNVTIYNSINDSRDIINIYTKSSVLVASYRSNQTNYSIDLTEGTYYLEDSKNNFEKLYFKINSNGDLLVKDGDDYVLARYLVLASDSISKSFSDSYKKTYNRGIVDNGTIDKKYDDKSKTYYVDGLDDISISITNEIETTTDVTVEWLSNVVDCPITSLDKTAKYIIGAMIMCTGIYLVIINAKKKEVNN